MELKRGWWKEIGGEHAYVDVQGKSGDWYGVDSEQDIAAWKKSGMSIHGDPYDLTDVYCGDGPEPVEPLQLCLGWWERRDGFITFIKCNHNDGPFHWESGVGFRYNDQWQFSRAGLSIPHHLDIVKRRPDLDAKEAKEAAEQQATPDPRDAEIERLRTENAKLKNDLDNIKRIIGDH